MPATPFGTNPGNTPRQPAAHVLRAMAVAQAKPLPAISGPAIRPPAWALPAPPLRPPLGPPQRVLQRALTFDSNERGRWIPDKANCQICEVAIGWGSRHHCRVCGRSVCGVCAGTKYQVSHRFEAGGRSDSAASSSERVRVDCVPKRKIALASRVPEFAALLRDANTGAGNTVEVDWGRFGAEGQFFPGGARINLDPATAADPFSVYLFELTNAVNRPRHRGPGSSARRASMGTTSKRWSSGRLDSQKSGPGDQRSPRRLSGARAIRRPPRRCGKLEKLPRGSGAQAHLEIPPAMDGGPGGSPRPRPRPRRVPCGGSARLGHVRQLDPVRRSRHRVRVRGDLRVDRDHRRHRPAAPVEKRLDETGLWPKSERRPLEFSPMIEARHLLIEGRVQEWAIATSRIRPR